MATPSLNRDYERRAYWQATMPALPDRRGRKLPDTADVVIVGGGYTGVAAARRLARSGRKVVLLEANHLGWGASTRNGGIIHPGYKWGPDTLVKRWGQETGRALYRETVEAFAFLTGLIRDEGIDCELRTSGHLEVAWGQADADHFGTEREALAAVGVTSRIVPRDRIRDEIGTDAYFGAIAIDGSGVLHPGKWFAGLVGLADRAGADLHEGVRARALRPQADGRVVVETERGPIIADHVLIATNGYTDGVAPSVRRRLIPIGSYLIATEPLTEAQVRETLPTGRAVFDTKNFLNYWHISADRRMIFGGRVSFMPTWTGRTAKLLYNQLMAIHPQLEGVRVAHAWGGKVALTMDRMPHVGRTGGANGRITYSVGYSGTGVVASTYLGTKAAEWIEGGEPPVIAKLRFPIVPAPYEGRPWFLPFVGEWFRIQDRRARGGGPEAGRLETGGGVG